MWLMVNSGNNYQKLNKAFCNEDMKTDKPTAKEIPEIGFDGIFPPETTVLMQFDLKRQISSVTMNEVIEPTGFLGGAKRETYHSKPNCFTTAAATFDYPHI